MPLAVSALLSTRNLNYVLPRPTSAIDKSPRIAIHDQTIVDLLTDNSVRFALEYSLFLSCSSYWR